MTGSGPLEPLPVILRGAEGLGLLFLVVVVLAAGSCMKRTIQKRAQKNTRASLVSGRTA
jgi:hypothetical protein